MRRPPATAAFREWSAFMERYVPSVSKSNGQAVYGYLDRQARWSRS